MTRRKVKWNVYVEAKSRDALIALAHKEKRSPSLMLEWLIEQELLRRGAKADRSAAPDPYDRIVPAPRDVALAATDVKKQIPD
jgi:hypothetical protein